MLEFDLKFYLGIVLFVAAGVGLLLNVSVAAPVFRLAFAKDKSTIYVISSVNILNDIVHLMISTFYLAPTIILHSFWFSENRNGHFSLFISFIFMVLWYIGNIAQIVMAVNRWCVICLHKHSFFTRRNLIIIFAITIICAIVKSYIIQYVFPCCAFIVDHTVLSYSYFQIDNLPNYTDQSDIPLNALSSIIPVLCYSHIYYEIVKASRSISPTMRTELQKRRGRQELSYAMQFCLISFFYTFSWIMFRVFPLIFDGRQIEWFILTALCHVCNCSANAFVYIMFNKEVQRQLSTNKLLKFSGMANVIETHSSEHHTTQSRVHTIPIPTARQHTS